MEYVPPKGVKSVPEMKTDIKFENISDSYVKYRPGIEKMMKKFWRSPKMKYLPPPKRCQKVPKLKKFRALA